MSTTVVSAVRAASPAEALEHFRKRLSFETDCADVHAGQTSGSPDFVLVDVRSRPTHAKGHVPGSVNIPHGELTEENLAEYPMDTLFVVYCAGPHCNGANRGAVRLAELGRPVKEMIGGMTGWIDEGFDVERP